MQTFSAIAIETGLGRVRLGLVASLALFVVKFDLLDLLINTFFLLEFEFLLDSTLLSIKFHYHLNIST